MESLRLGEAARRPDALTASLEWTLRVGAFLCFVGHGAFGIMTKAAWVPYFGVAGIGSDMAYRLMPLVGMTDITMGFLILLRPRPVVALWMLIWAVWTALLRPLSGEPGWEALERAGNYGVPAVLALLLYRPARWVDWFTEAQRRALRADTLDRARHILTATVALLLLGHGALGVIGKQGLTDLYASVLPGIAPALTPVIGWMEIGLAAVVAAWQSPAFLVGIAVWKLATEALFLTAGAPAWEIVERGGSYAAPIALAIVLVLRGHRPRVTGAAS